METIEHEVRIRIVTENVDGKIEAFINRPDKYKTFFYNSISIASVNRLANLAEKLHRSGYNVYTNYHDKNGNLTCTILLQ